MATLTAHAPNTQTIRPWVSRFVRIGYAAKGLIYLLIGTLALRLALGNGGRLTDADGALRTIVEQPFGRALLAIIGGGLTVYAAWELAGAVAVTKLRGASGRGLMDRGLSVIKAVVYGAVGVQALRMVAGAGASSRDADDYARTAMRVPMGDVLLIAIGAGVASYGLKQIVNAWRSEFDDDIDQHQLRREGGSWVVTIGRAGIGARGVILVLVGAALARAGFDESPAEAGGLAEAMWTVFAQPYGHYLLAAVAAGLMCFGVFQLLHARYARV